MVVSHRHSHSVRILAFSVHTIPTRSHISPSHWAVRQATGGTRHPSSHGECAKETALLEAYVQWDATGLPWDTAYFKATPFQTLGRVQLWYNATDSSFKWQNKDTAACTRIWHVLLHLPDFLVPLAHTMLSPSGQCHLQSEWGAHSSHLGSWHSGTSGTGNLHHPTSAPSLRSRLTTSIRRCNVTGYHGLPSICASGEFRFRVLQLRDPVELELIPSQMTTSWAPAATFHHKPFGHNMHCAVFTFSLPTSPSHSFPNGSHWANPGKEGWDFAKPPKASSI